MIDFDDCGWGYDVLDLASVLDSFSRRVAKDPKDYLPLRDAYLRGYDRIQALPVDMQGYRTSKDTDMEPLRNAFSVINEANDYFADVYPISVGANGEISMAVYKGTQSVWDGMLTIQGDRAICVI